MRIRVLIIAAAGVTLGAVQAGAQDAAAGEEIYQDSCKNCHGPRAQGMASFPRLAGQDEDHLVMRLEQYRAGERVGANSALMQPHAEELSDDDIANIVAYITTNFE